jgi:hypothetical protein
LAEAEAVEVTPVGDTDLDCSEAVPVDATKVGAACTKGPECVTSFCLTSTFAHLLSPDIEIPNGYCSVLQCTIGAPDAKCTADNGGACFSLAPFVGTDPSWQGKGLCFRPCTSDCDCRMDEGYRCLNPKTEFVDAGLMSQADYDTLYKDQTACAPNSIIDAAKQALKDAQAAGGKK